MSKHTQGPWEWCGNDLDGGKHQEFSVLEVKVSCAAYCYGGMANIAVSVEDAKLIAAAPELLEALEAIVNSLSEHDDEGMIEHTDQMQAARAAIAKGRGDK